MEKHTTSQRTDLKWERLRLQYLRKCRRTLYTELLATDMQKVRKELQAELPCRCYKKAKKDDCNSKGLKPFCVPLAVHHIAGKAGDAFTENDVHLSRLGIGSHLLKSRAVLCLSCRMPVCVDFDQFPLRVTLDQIRIVPSLGLKALYLVLTQGADTAISRHTLSCNGALGHDFLNYHLLLFLSVWNEDSLPPVWLLSAGHPQGALFCFPSPVPHYSQAYSHFPEYDPAWHNSVLL